MGSNRLSRDIGHLTGPIPRIDFDWSNWQIGLIDLTDLTGPTSQSSESVSESVGPSTFQHCRHCLEQNRDVAGD